MSILHIDSDKGNGFPLSLVMKAIARLGISDLNEMQRTVVSVYEETNDLVLLSPTGSGKTLAYLLPLLAQLNADIEGPQAIIIVPTRELAMQIEQVFKSIGSGFKVDCCYGGHSAIAERKSLQNPPALLIGTPGRLLDHLNRNSFDPSTVRTWILDEFDKSLEMGFQDEMSAIIGQLKQVRKRILTSATSRDIPDFTGVKHPRVLNYLSKKEEVDDRMTLYRVDSPEKDKLDTLFALLTGMVPGSTLIFCNQRESVDRIGRFLFSKGIVAECFHGGMEQPDRERALCRFRNGSSLVLISTDLAARGLDIPDIRSVVHYHLPADEDTFTHRNGRTARMHAFGSVYLIVGPEENIPVFVSEKLSVFVPEAVGKYRPEPKYVTLYIGVGKKDKVNKVDIVGFLLQKGQLDKADVGLIEIKEYHAYAAIDRRKASQLLSRIRNEKIKNKKTKFEISGDDRSRKKR